MYLSYLYKGVEYADHSVQKTGRFYVKNPVIFCSGLCVLLQLVR